MNWLNGYAASWKAVRVNLDTWEDGANLDGARGASIERDCTDDVPLLESGTLMLDSDDGFENGYYRIYMTAKQGSAERIAVATMLFEQANSRKEMGVEVVTAKGHSVLKPADNRRLAQGTYAPAGVDGSSYVAQMLRECITAPVEVDGGFVLVNDVVFDLGCTYLQACWLVLEAGGWCMQIDGYGVVHVLPRPTKPALDLDKAHAELLLPGVDFSMDYAEIPNRYIAVEYGETETAENYDDTAITSYRARGRWVDMIDSSPLRVNGETLYGYARRRLAEESTVTRTVSYIREFWPDILPYSVIRWAMPTIGVEGDLTVLSQSLECGNGITVQETSGYEERV